MCHPFLGGQDPPGRDRRAEVGPAVHVPGWARPWPSESSLAWPSSAWSSGPRVASTRGEMGQREPSGPWLPGSQWLVVWREVRGEL